MTSSRGRWWWWWWRRSIERGCWSRRWAGTESASARVLWRRMYASGPQGRSFSTAARTGGPSRRGLLRRRRRHLSGVSAASGRFVGRAWIRDSTSSSSRRRRRRRCPSCWQRWRRKRCVSSGGKPRAAGARGVCSGSRGAGPRSSRALSR
ncbi:hypothetical protein LZ30DRAFT_723166 [Colletotrichum cereale]|nr:hypothetical protein LZ30DRAFT_723166 [Colletotrichum cereale]